MTQVALVARKNWMGHLTLQGGWKNKLLNEDCKRIHEERHELNRLVFAYRFGITSTPKDAVKQGGFKQFGWTLEPYDLDRLRTRLARDLRHLIAQQPAIFCRPFFPTRGEHSISECRDTLVIESPLRRPCVGNLVGETTATGRLSDLVLRNGTADRRSCRRLALRLDRTAGTAVLTHLPHDDPGICRIACTKVSAGRSLSTLPSNAL
ncbi:hypothetical protein Q31a_36050 [Aureliella helgolandensis]|uniref:Uncharacterized protein n=1 Tax=Aureliella helgolandensis TaxID=2527968 RepID=A0A518G9M0_9BACT|nr:hypothetical protein Q31a_36050 [Aureliella helgolandensis]